MTEVVTNDLLRCREAFGATREQVAEAVDVTAKTLYRYETGSATPKIDVALRLAQYYHKSVEDLFHLECPLSGT